MANEVLEFWLELDFRTYRNFCLISYFIGPNGAMVDFGQFRTKIIHAIKRRSEMYSSLTLPIFLKWS